MYDPYEQALARLSSQFGNQRVETLLGKIVTAIRKVGVSIDNRNIHVTRIAERYLTILESGTNMSLEDVIVEHMKNVRISPEGNPKYQQSDR